MKAVFSTDLAGHVTLTCDDRNGDRVTREFTCPTEGGYIRERYGNGDWKQVCDRLSGVGPTLTAGSRKSLLDNIRREYRAKRAHDKREFA